MQSGWNNYHIQNEEESLENNKHDSKQKGQKQWAQASHGYDALGHEHI